MKLKISLSEQGIQQTIDALYKYRRDLISKVHLLRERVARLIADSAQSGFDGSIVDDLLNGDARQANVSVSVDNKDNITLIIANGEDAVWVEFGAGVYHNGSVGSSPHPKGAELGFLIGTYGTGRGKQKTWRFKEDGEVKRTFGTPATMPMYKAIVEVSKEIHKIAKEVFG